MKAYKGFTKTDDGKLMCRNMEYDVGKTYVFDGDIEMCRRGYHACHTLVDVFAFYPNDGNNAFCEVECGGKIIESDNGDGKLVCSEIKIIREIGVADMPLFNNIVVMHADKGLYAIEKYNDNESLMNIVDKNLHLMSERWFVSKQRVLNRIIVQYDDNKKFNMIDIDGNTYFSEDVDCIDASDDILRVKTGGLWHLADINANFITKNGFDAIFNFRNGMAQVVDSFSGVNLIRTDGSLVLDYYVDYAEICDDGLVKIKDGRKWAYMSIDGRKLVRRRFHMLDDFHNGYARVKLNDKYNFVDIKGEYLSDRWFDTASDFHGGNALVSNDGRFGVIDVFGCVTALEIKQPNGYGIENLTEKCGGSQEGKCLSFQPIDLSQKCVFEETPGVYEICEEKCKEIYYDGCPSMQ